MSAYVSIASGMRRHPQHQRATRKNLHTSAHVRIANGMPRHPQRQRAKRKNLRSN
jgi:hypothetical protein